MQTCRVMHGPSKRVDLCFVLRGADTRFLEPFLPRRCRVKERSMLLGHGRLCFSQQLEFLLGVKQILLMGTQGICQITFTVARIKKLTCTMFTTSQRQG